MKPIFIIADDRERDSGVIEALSVLEGVKVRVERLKIGDYRVGKNLLFERKTLSDLTISIVQGRFFSQSQRLASSPYRGVIILEGKGRDIYHTSVKREAVQGALINVSVLMGLPILRSVDPAETADLMVYAGRQLGKTISGGLYRHGYRPKGKRKKQIFFLQGLPGVGPERASSLLDNFGNVENIMTASPGELAQVPGIGRKTAKSIRGVLKEPPPPYRTDITHIL